ncbi:MAG: iron-containing alcohol dehydrogenase [Thermoprotei archaeon]
MWFFRSPEIIFGEDSLSYLSTLNIRRAVIVTDRYLKDSEPLRLVSSSLPEGAERMVVADVSAEPTHREMTSSLEHVRAFEPDWFIAVGGGSSIDTAKVLFALYERPDISVYDITPIVTLNLRRKSRLAAVPTTSGTGSECSWAAVISEEGERRKHELASKEIMPDVAILDPKVVLGLPREQSRNTAVDAVVHAVEAYTSAWRNPYSDALAEKALELIAPNLPVVLAQPGNTGAREAVHIGASMAGLAFSNSQIGLAHALGHALGAVFRLPHGKCVGLFLPYVVAYNYPAAAERYGRLNALLPEQFRSGRLDESLRKYFEYIGQPLTLKDAGVGREEFLGSLDTLVRLASEDTGVTTNARDAGSAEIRGILQHASGWGDA